MRLTRRIVATVGMALMFATVFISCKPYYAEEQKKTNAVSDTTFKVVNTAFANQTDVKKPAGNKTVPINKKTKNTMETTPLTIHVTNLKGSNATIEISIYGYDDKFPKPNKQLKKYRVEPVDGKLELEITDLPYGEYAVALYQDENNNGKIDKNIFGIPKERYAFSQNFKPKLKAPKFSDCKFDYSTEKATIEIALLK